MYKFKIAYFLDIDRSNHKYIVGILKCISHDENSICHNNVVFIDPMCDYPVDDFENKRTSIYTTGIHPASVGGLEELNIEIERILKDAKKFIDTRRGVLDKQNTLNLKTYKVEY